MNWNKQQVILIFLLLFGGSAFGQTVLIGHDVEKDLSEPSAGYNRDYYLGSIWGGGLIFGPSETDSASINMGRSYQLHFGTRQKFQFGAFYALGSDFTFDFRSYSIRQDSLKRFPNAFINDKERLNLLDARYELYNRFNFLKRGDHMGLYLDLGGYIGYTFYSRHITWNEYDLNGDKFKSKNVVRSLDYIRRFNYGLVGRIGYNFITFYFQYRLADLFRDDATYGFSDLPVYSAGISFDIPNFE